MVYCYATDDAGVTQRMEKTYPMGKAPPRVRHGGRVYYRDLVAENAGTQMPSCWPMKSDAMGVHPSQIAETQATLAKHGVSTEFDREGTPILRDRAHRRKHARVFGYYDQDGGYGDPQKGQ